MGSSWGLSASPAAADSLPYPPHVLPSLPCSSGPRWLMLPSVLTAPECVWELTFPRATDMSKLTLRAHLHWLLAQLSVNTTGSNPPVSAASSLWCWTLPLQPLLPPEEHGADFTHQVSHVTYSHHNSSIFIICRETYLWYSTCFLLHLVSVHTLWYPGYSTEWASPF